MHSGVNKIYRFFMLVDNWAIKGYKRINSMFVLLANRFGISKANCENPVY